MGYLYDLYKRDEAPIPLRNTYTGLADLYIKELGKREVDRQVELWHDEKTQGQIRASNTANPVRLDFDLIQNCDINKEASHEVETAT
tara:strand:- start:8105 stop:8365 length:261 start_codon:yes stop_codon:yes gene_type:complete